MVEEEAGGSLNQKPQTSTPEVCAIRSVGPRCGAGNHGVESELAARTSAVVKVRGFLSLKAYKPQTLENAGSRHTICALQTSTRKIYRSRWLLSGNLTPLDIVAPNMTASRRNLRK